jgi:cyclophilin family peptidyl-prolyl cis-trans isomerase
MRSNRIFSLILALLLCLSALALSGCSTHKAPAFAELDFTAVDPAACVETNEVTTLVKLSVKDFGDVIIRLYPEVAPRTVANFQKLVSEHFYDGLTFHRVMKDFMVQTGDPDGDGTGGSKDEIRGEFDTNGFENNLKHIRGTVSMARRGNDKNSASSQFFIVHKTNSSSTNLNGKYASFGYVIAGMEVVDAIASVPVVATDRGEMSIPKTAVTIDTIRFVKVAQ